MMEQDIEMITMQQATELANGPPILDYERRDLIVKWSIQGPPRWHWSLANGTLEEAVAYHLAASEEIRTVDKRTKYRKPKPLGSEPIAYGRVEVPTVEPMEEPLPPLSRLAKRLQISVPFFAVATTISYFVNPTVFVWEGLFGTTVVFCVISSVAILNDWKRKT